MSTSAVRCSRRDAYVGMTVVYADGRKVTTLVAYPQ